MKKHNKQKRLAQLAMLISFIVIGLSYSCGNAKSTSAKQESIEKSPKIFFLNYTLKKSKNGQVSAYLINTIKTDGKLKKSMSSYHNEGALGDLECNQLDKKQKSLQSILIKNPLSKDFEYIDDSKEFKTAHVELDSAEFSIRLQLLPNTKYISISRYQSKQKNQPLILTQVN